MIIVLFNKNKDVTIIPNNAIRFRIIANSNSDIDQDFKKDIINKIEPILFDISVNSITKEKTVATINEHMDILHKEISKYTDNYSINYGYNYFPEKIYKNVKYNAGNYESLVISLGDALGDNWWCVLFPPLCLLEAEEQQETKEVEYKFFVSELIDKYFK